MIKRIKYSITLILVLAVLLTNSFFVSGNVSDAGLAVSAGKNYGDGVNTIQDAINASSAYANAGYTAVTITSPTKSSFTTDYLQADILFLSGHGDKDTLSFGSDVKFVCQSGTVSGNYINLWRTVQYQRIITLAGCNTALSGGTTEDGVVIPDRNITRRAWLQGAGAAVGWSSPVAADSHTNWLKRYNDALAAGKTVGEAIDKANSYIYFPNSGVKNVVLYGDENIKISSTSSQSVERVFDEPSMLSVNNLDVLNEISDLALKYQTAFQTDDFAGYVYKTKDGFLVDAYYKSNGIITNSAITLQVSNTGEVLGYKTHNIAAADFSSVPAFLSSVSVKAAAPLAKEKIASEERADLAVSETLIEQEQFEYYDVTTGNTYLVTYTKVTDDIGAMYVKENISLID